MTDRRPFFAANWKMNKLLRESTEYPSKLVSALGDVAGEMNSRFDVMVAPPATHLETVTKSLRNTGIHLGAQNTGIARFGAYTGENSPAVLKELGCEWVLAGHSERRHVFKEDDYLIVSRVKAALEEGLQVVFCIGEVLQDRRSGKTFKVVEGQLSAMREANLPTGFWEKVVIAYEPVWAIGTGENATPQQAQEVHLFIRQWLAEKYTSSEANKVRILYGGSVKPENAGQILAQKDVDGLLVGTASLDPAVFAGVIRNGLKSRN